MKKFFALLIAFAMIAALGVPAFAYDGDPIFDTVFTRVENEPTVEYDEWEIPYNVWTPMENSAPVAIGDTVTMRISYTVPSETEDFDERAFGSIEYMLHVDGIDELELVEAMGCDPLLDCDYEIGICVPVPGEYANIFHEGNNLMIMAEPGSTVSVVVRGVATSEQIHNRLDVRVGQYHFPAYFYEKVVDKKDEGIYNVHWSDFMLVQKRSVEFRPGNMFVALNNHYHRMETDGSAPTAFIPVDENFADCGEPLAADSELFATLTDIFATVHELFDIDYDQTSFTDADFIGSGDYAPFWFSFTFGTDEDAEPTEAPVDPTEAPAPADPTEAPAPADPTEAPAPADPTEAPSPAPAPVPGTGTISLAVLGIAAAVSGAAVCFSRRKAS